MLDKILGGLYGQALGDAWAMPAMLDPETTWQVHGGWITEFRPAPDDHPAHHGLKAGMVTDDTQQAFALAEVIITDGGITAAGAARAISAWYDQVGGDTAPFVGPSTRRAVMAIRGGMDIYQTGRFGDTNGAAMRVSPVGLIHPGDPEGALQDAYESCIPTHHTNTAVSGAAAVAAAVAAAMPENATLDDIIAAGMRAADAGLALGYPWMGASIARRIDMAVQIATTNRSERARLREMYDVIGTTLAVTEAVPAAFGVLAMAKGDPLQAAIYAAGLSGDADTVGAMACAIAGAWKGLSAFPAEIARQLREANPQLDFEETARGLWQVIKKREL